MTVTFYSHISGYLTELNISEGEYVFTGTALFRIAEQSSVWVDAEIYQNEISYLIQTPEIVIQCTSLPNQTFTGQITQNARQWMKTKKLLPYESW
ncbi:MAG: efflux RND transporter periplasmic adaptor subunit [Bacteroidia bacterium]